MPLSKQSGNMYEFVTHMHAHLRGACEHGCGYCFVQSGAARWEGRFHKPSPYRGPVTFVDDSLKVDYNAPAVWREAQRRAFQRPVIFIDHMNDLFAEGVNWQWIEAVLGQCRKAADVEFVFQTKNPARLLEYVAALPPRRVVGTTIESNRWYPKVMGKAPPPVKRFKAFTSLSLLMVPAITTFITIEPILKFDLETMANWICAMRPTFVNIGADSKGHGLDEPSWKEVMALYEELTRCRIQVRQKSNLERLKK